MGIPIIGRCENCVFWMQYKPEQNNELGICQRYPPVLIGKQSLQPDTWKNTLCGEYIPRGE